MRFYRNKDTGDIMNADEAREEWRTMYDGDDPTNVCSFTEQYTDVTNTADGVKAAINDIILSHEPADSFKYQLLDRLRTDCDYFLGHGFRDPSELWAGSVGTHLEAMRLLWDSFPEDKRPEWLTREDLEEYARKMEGAAE